MYNAILKIMKESYKKQSKDTKYIHIILKFIIEKKTSKGEIVNSYKIKDRMIFTIYKNK